MMLEKRVRGTGTKKAVKNRTVATTPFTMRLDPDVRAEMEKVAEQDDRSLSYVIHKALREWLASRKR